MSDWQDQLPDLMLAFYDMARADILQAKGVSDVFEEAGSDLEGLSGKCKTLVEMGLAQWGNIGFMRLTAKGVDWVEERQRRLLADQCPVDPGDSRIPAIAKLLLQVEWERYLVLSSVHADALKRGHYAEMWTDDRRQDGDDHERAMFYLENKGWLEIRGGRGRVTAEGQEALGRIEKRLRALGLEEVDREGFKAAAIKEWKRDLRKTSIEAVLQAEFRHSDDYRSVSIRGADFALAERQAKVIKMLDAAHRAGTPDVSKSKIMKALGYDESGSVADVFKPNHRDAYRALIKRTGRGLYRLSL